MSQLALWLEPCMSRRSMATNTGGYKISTWEEIDTKLMKSVHMWDM